MLFEGQEFLQGGWFQDTVPVDWHQNDEFQGIVRLYRDLIALRRNLHGSQSEGFAVAASMSITSTTIRTCSLFIDGIEVGQAMTWLSWSIFQHKPREGYTIGLPSGGLWRLRLNSAWRGYSSAFSNHPSHDLEAVPGAYDGLSHHAAVSIAPYTMLIYSQE